MRRSASFFRLTIFFLGLLSGAVLVRPAAAQITEIERLEAAKQAFDKKDYDRAYYGWMGLCQDGNRGSCYNVGLMYATGVGAPVDRVEAYKWMEIAAQDGSPEAIAGRARLASSMTPGEIKDAMERAEEWKRVNGR